jgi:hypothetical protein
MRGVGLKGNALAVRGQRSRLRAGCGRDRELTPQPPGNRTCARVHTYVNSGEGEGNASADCVKQRERARQRIEGVDEAESGDGHLAYVTMRQPRALAWRAMR